MGFLSRFRGGDDEPEDQTCPKCRMPAPAAAETCPECGWDMREAYHPEPAPTDVVDRRASGAAPVSSRPGCAWLCAWRTSGEGR